MDYVREMSVTGDSRARQLADLLDQVGLTPDFQPNEVTRLQQKAA